MDNIYDINGLLFWNEREIRLRKVMVDHFKASVQDALLSINSAWRFFECEAPLLTPRNLINPNYTNDDIFAQSNTTENLVLRPETTPGSYVYATHLLKTHQTKTPFVVWQIGKSFRRETDQVMKNMRLKEFHQQEFQCIYTTDTKADYHALMIPHIEQMIKEMVGLPTRVVESDRLPSYSEITLDVEVDNGDKWMEVCSISRRRDFPEKVKFETKQGIVERDVKVLEIAIGLDRCVMNFEIRNSKFNK